MAEIQLMMKTFNELHSTWQRVTETVHEHDTQLERDRKLLAYWEGCLAANSANIVIMDCIYGLVFKSSLYLILHYQKLLFHALDLTKPAEPS